MRLNSRFKVALRRWHRRLGILLSLVLILLSLTGILLNHTSELELDQYFISSPWLVRSYGVSPPTTANFFEENKTKILHIGDQLWFNDRYIMTLDSTLLGTKQWQQWWIVLCKERLFLLDEQGEVMEWLTTEDGLPTDILGLKHHPTQLIINSVQGLFELEANSLTLKPFQPFNALPNVQQQNISPEQLIKFQDQYLSRILHYQQVLLDLHSGRILGMASVYLMDLLAIFLVILSLSGIIIWSKRS